MLRLMTGLVEGVPEGGYARRIGVVVVGGLCVADV